MSNGWEYRSRTNEQLAMRNGRESRSRTNEQLGMRNEQWKMPGREIPPSRRGRHCSSLITHYSLMTGVWVEGLGRGSGARLWGEGEVNES
jgi:hypothetical protein